MKTKYINISNAECKRDAEIADNYMTSYSIFLRPEKCLPQESRFTKSLEIKITVSRSLKI